LQWAVTLPKIFGGTKLYDGNNKTQKALKKCKNGKAQHCKKIAFNF
jgi:hypothetical protein